LSRSFLGDAAAVARPLPQKTTILRYVREYKGIVSETPVEKFSPEWWLYSQALVLIPAIRLCLSVISFDLVRSALSLMLPSPDHGAGFPEPSDDDQVTAAARLIKLAGEQTPVPNTCLHRSLAAWCLLGRRGFECRLRFGVRKDDGQLHAHAWVEHRGTVLNDDPTVAQAYMPLTGFPTESARFTP
jgi:hypothetical protein